MNVVLLSPYFPTNYYNFAVALRQNGVNVLGLGDTPYDQLRPELRDALTEYYRVDDLHDYDQLVRACGYFTHRYGKLDRIESHNEYWLETEARLRTDFNVSGPKTDDIAWVKQKSKMKQVFDRAGIAVARGAVVKDIPAAIDLIRKTKYPVVAKPDIGVGAAATYKIANADDLAGFFAEKPPVDYIMEAFISGDLYSFDGLVDRDGRILFYTSHFFSQGIMETVNDDLDIVYYSLRELPPGLEDAGRRTVAAFGLRERFFHIEFFLVGGERWVALEINMRPPGGLTMDMFNFANDANFFQVWADVVAGKVVDGTYARPYHCAYVGRKDTLRHRMPHDAIMRAYGDIIVHHGPMSAVLSPALGNYAYLLRSPDLDVILDASTQMRALERGGR